MSRRSEWSTYAILRRMRRRVGLWNCCGYMRSPIMNCQPRPQVLKRRECLGRSLWILEGYTCDRRMLCPNIHDGVNSGILPWEITRVTVHRIVFETFIFLYVHFERHSGRKYVIDNMDRHSGRKYVYFTDGVMRSDTWRRREEQQQSLSIMVRNQVLPTTPNVGDSSLLVSQVCMCPGSDLGRLGSSHVVFNSDCWVADRLLKLSSVSLGKPQHK